MDKLPVIDISPLHDLDIANWQATIDEIDHALRTYGFMYITGHGVKKELTGKLYARAQEFFALPEDTKRAISIDKSGGYRGWSSLGSEKLEKDLPADLKESFDMGIKLSADHPDAKSDNPFYCVNLFPEAPDIQKTAETYFEEVMLVALKVMQAMALALDQKLDFFDQNFDHSTSILRILHYLPSEHKTHPDQPGAGAHTDYGCLTILSQDEVGGLQVKHKNGQWIDAPPLDGCYIVNVGDMMARWTNGRYKSTLHRVTGDLKTDRYSVPFFVEPNYNTKVEVLQSCLEPGEQAKYPPIISGEWLASRFEAAYNGEGLENDG